PSNPDTTTSPDTVVTLIFADGDAVIATLHRWRELSVNILMKRSIGAWSASGCATWRWPSRYSTCTSAPDRRRTSTRDFSPGVIVTSPATIRTTTFVT